MPRGDFGRGPRIILQPGRAGGEGRSVHQAVRPVRRYVNMDNGEQITDCFVCQLPSEPHGEFALNDEEWVMLVCIAGHVVTVRPDELPEFRDPPAAA